METNLINKILNHFIVKRIKDYENIEGWLTKNEALALYMIANKLPQKATVVEIGSWQGKSTYCIAKGLKSGNIYAIDPFNADAGLDIDSADTYVKQKGDKSLLGIFCDNMRKYNVEKKVIVKEGYSNDFFSHFTKIDFLFIDGDHSIEGCKNDYQLYANKIVKGGFIAFHDYYNDRPLLGPTFVVNKIINQSNDFTFYRQSDSLWIGIKS